MKLKEKLESARKELLDGSIVNELTERLMKNGELIKQGENLIINEKK